MICRVGSSKKLNRQCQEGQLVINWHWDSLLRLKSGTEHKHTFEGFVQSFLLQPERGSAEWELFQHAGKTKAGSLIGTERCQVFCTKASRTTSPSRSGRLTQFFWTCHCKAIVWKFRDPEIILQNIRLGRKPSWSHVVHAHRIKGSLC